MHSYPNVVTFGGTDTHLDSAIGPLECPLIVRQVVPVLRGPVGPNWLVHERGRTVRRSPDPLCVLNDLVAVLQGGAEAPRSRIA